MPLRIWANLRLTPAETAEFAKAIAPHELRTGDTFETANIAIGQPDVDSCLASEQLHWVHLGSAGWDKFDQPRVRARFAERGVQLTTSASVYSEPCAQHLLAFMLAEARQLPRSIAHQCGDHAWPQLETRAACRLLGPDATVLLVGFGSIATRLAALLAPFGARVLGARRSPTGLESVPTFPTSELPRLLPECDHVLNILPGGDSTRNFFDAARFASMKPGAVFYNIGRGSTVDQLALSAALESGRLRAAYLDVADPEPLPPTHSLWRAPNCTITPHAAGGHATEPVRHVAHALRNLQRFTAGEALLDRVL